jgi:hypothetical protein
VNDNRKQEQAAAAGEPRQVVVEKRHLVELLASDANQAIVGAVAGTAGGLATAGALKLMGKLHGQDSGGQGGGQDGGTKSGPPAEG